MMLSRLPRFPCHDCDTDLFAGCVENVMMLSRLLRFPCHDMLS